MSVSPVVGAFGAAVLERKERRKRMTSSRISSSHRLSLKPSDAKIRMSSSMTGRVKTCASCGLVAEAGPNWTGVLNYKAINSLIN